MKNQEKNITEKPMSEKRWLITLFELDKSDEEIFNILKGFKNVKYFCFKRECDENLREHIHCFIKFSVHVSFVNLKEFLVKDFKYSSLYPCVGDDRFNYDYVTKRIDGSNKPYEFGELKKSKDIDEIVKISEMIDAGASVEEIKKSYFKTYLKCQNMIENLVLAKTIKDKELN